jgi:adenosine deaminase
MQQQKKGIKAYGVEAGIILCALRHYSEAQSIETFELGNQFKGIPIVGFDIAADEAGFPITNHIKAFEFANANNIQCTAHAGEAKELVRVWQTLRIFILHVLDTEFVVQRTNPDCLS